MTKYTYHIRRATQSDIVILTELRMAFLRDFAGQTGRDVSAELEKATQGFLAAAVPKNEFIAWLAVSEDGDIIGSSGLVFFQRAPTAGNLSGLEAYILNMYTLPSWRGRGVATALLKETMDYVKSTPARRIFLQAAESVQPIYRRLGFTNAHNTMELSLE